MRVFRYSFSGGFVAAMVLGGALSLAPPAFCQTVQLRTLAPDPYGYPRPASGQANVPLRTSYYIELGVADQTDDVLPNSVTMRLTPQGDSAFYVLQANQQFQPGYSGTLKAASAAFSNQKMVSMNIDSAVPLIPSKQYTVTLTATSAKGSTFSGGQTTYSFTTEPGPTTHTLAAYNLNVGAAATHWTGGFFTGFCKPSYCTSEFYGRVPGYDLMRDVRQWSPKAWSLQRDWWITGHHDQPAFLPGNQPNAVRELETRRIDVMTTGASATVLHLTDFFGHEQYGIASGRALSLDYHVGDRVLIADGFNSAQTTVTAVNDAAWQVTVNNFATPADGWKIAYTGALPTQEDPKAPGLFPFGGCYLRKFSPTGTPRYYWGRIDKEEDLIAQQYGRRLLVNFCDAPGDLSIDGRANTTAKNYPEMHEVAHAITTHLIDRYGTATLEFVWSIGNEPDLGALFWRTTWDEFQKFYDYTADGILRAFEDKGFDSSRVYIGGLEFGSAPTWGSTKCKVFLGHASPTAVYAGEISQNTAYADPTLNGKRSQRVTNLCAANAGKGTPLDFVSTHCYSGSVSAAADMKWVKDQALAIDPVYFANLAIHTHESCPNWAPPPDVAAVDSYLGNGYFPTWCADVTRRLLQQASADARYGFGESILTFWPWPNGNLGGWDDVTQVLNVDSDNNGTANYQVTLPLPTLNFLGLLNTMGSNYWVLPEQVQHGHTVAGFASRPTADEVRILFYSHQGVDTQSRSDRAFVVPAAIGGLNWPQAHVQQYRFDKANNSFYAYAKQLGSRPLYTAAEVGQLTSLSQMRPTGTAVLAPSGGNFTVNAELLSNGANFLILTPQEIPAARVGDWLAYR